MDRPVCLEDVFALVSSVCNFYSAGAKSFWYVGEEQRVFNDNTDKDGAAATESTSTSSSSLVLSPRRVLQTLDLLQSNTDSLLFVYLSFLVLLALLEGPNDMKETANNGASVIHSFLSGQQPSTHHLQKEGA